MSITIMGSVGKGGVNSYADVVTVQQLLNNVPRVQGGPETKLAVDGKVGPKTITAIQQFQLHHFGWSIADGRVDPGGRTLAKLQTFIPLSTSFDAANPLPIKLEGAVGRGGANRPADVVVIQTLLNHLAPSAGRSGPPLTVDGKVGPKTIAAIEHFQRSVVGQLSVSGCVEPEDETLRALLSWGGIVENTAGNNDPLVANLLEDPDAGVPPPSLSPPSDVDIPWYSPAELTASALSNGQVLEIGNQSKYGGLLYDYEPGSWLTRPNHQSFLRKLCFELELYNRYHNLGSPTVAIIGSQDSIESIVSPFCAMERSNHVQLALQELGVRNALIPSVGDIVEGDRPIDQPPELRTSRRSASIEYQRVPDLPLPKYVSSKWALIPIRSVVFNLGGIGGVEIDFQIRDKVNNILYDAYFRGYSSVGLAAGVGLNPGTEWTAFETSRPIDVSRFAKAAVHVSSQSVLIFERAHLWFEDLLAYAPPRLDPLPVSTLPQEISIGGVSVGASYTAGVYSASGRLIIQKAVDDIA